MATSEIYGLCGSIVQRWISEQADKANTGRFAWMADQISVEPGSTGWPLFSCVFYFEYRALCDNTFAPEESDLTPDARFVAAKHLHKHGCHAGARRLLHRPIKDDVAHSHEPGEARIMWLREELGKSSIVIAELQGQINKARDREINEALSTMNINKTFASYDDGKDLMINAVLRARDGAHILEVIRDGESKGYYYHSEEYLMRGWRERVREATCSKPSFY